MFSWTYFKTRNVFLFGAIKRSLKLNWGVKRKMYSSVLLFFFFRYLLYCFLRGASCVCQCTVGRDTGSFDECRKNRGMDTKWQLPAVCAAGLSVWPPGPQHLLSDTWNQHSALLIVRQILTTQSLICSSWLVRNSLCGPSWPWTCRSACLCFQCWY